MDSASTDLMQDPGVKQASDKLTAFKTEFNDLERRVVENNNKLLSLREKNPVSPFERAAKALVAGTKFKDLVHRCRQVIHPTAPQSSATLRSSLNHPSESVH